MIVDKRHVNGQTVLGIEGVIKLGESARFFAETLDRILDEDAGHVIVDLSRINYMDSTGIGELVGYLGRFQERRRRLVLVNPAPRIQKLLEVAKLAPLLPTYASIEEALAAEAK